MKKPKIIHCPNPDCLYHQEGWESRSKDPRGPKRCPVCQAWLRKAHKKLKQAIEGPKAEETQAQPETHHA